MKSLKIAALIALTALGLAGCASWDQIVDNVASVAVSSVQGTPVPGQAKTVFGAKLTFDFLVKETQHYVDSGVATPAQKAAIHEAVPKFKAVIDAAETSARAGNNAAVAAALEAMNQENLKFSDLLTTLGVPIGK